MFQTQGDVTLEAFVKATMLMAGDRPRTLTIATPTLPENAMRTIRRYAELGYISTLRLMLSERPEAGVLDGIAAEVELAITGKVPSLMMWQGATGIVAIQGDMPDAVEPTLHLYAGIMGGVQSLNVHAAIDPFNALFRARRVEIEPVEKPDADATGEVGGDRNNEISESRNNEEAAATESKKTRKTKKTKEDEKSNQVVEGAQGAEA
jgi:hypothetical protein